MTRRARRTTLQHGVGLAALAFAVAAAPALPVRAQSDAETGAKSAREMTFTVPLVSDRRVLGDVLVRIPSSGPVAYETQSLRRELEPLLNEAGQARLDAALGARAFVDETVLVDAGFQIRFNANRLEAVIDSIEGSYRPVGTLGIARRSEEASSLPIVEPAGVSAFLIINASLDYDDLDGVQRPEFYLFGASRFGGLVVELDGAFSEQLGDSAYEFHRRSLRAIYDLPKRYMRISAGDVRSETVPLLRTPVIGGLSVERRRRTFRPILPASRLGGREIFLDTRSTVDILINGVEYQTVELDPGRYDLANLPLQFGSNNVMLRVRDAAGREQLIDYDYFFEPLELEAGDYEYVATVGFLSRELGYQPNYSDDLAAIGYFRKAFSETFILGGAAQVTQDRQVFSIDSTFVPQVLPGVLDFQGAVSTGGRTGYAFRAGYRWRGSGDMESRRQVNLSVDYQSADFQTLDGIFAPSFSTLTVNASVMQAFSLQTFATAGFSYIRQGGSLRDQTLAYAEVAHRLDNRFRIVAGVEYGDDSVYRRNFGVRLGLSMLFGGGHRGNVDYRSRTETFRATVARGPENHVGSWGYDLGFSDSRGDTSANASLDYIGNRFDARATVFTRGQGLDGLADRQRARLQVGTAIAFADGLFGIGRPINDSFALLRPHDAIAKADVITGRSLQSNRYEARSGPFGAAVQANIASYSPQNIHFDLAGAGTGYDLGDGVVRVDPPLHGGYKVVVGNNRYVTAVGILTVAGEPLGLVSGQLTSFDDEGFEPQPFFTNSAGRFGILGLAPGKTYLLKLSGDDRIIRIEIPDQNEGLYRVGTIDLPRPSE